MYMTINRQRMLKDRRFETCLRPYWVYLLKFEEQLPLHQRRSHPCIIPPEPGPTLMHPEIVYVLHLPYGAVEIEGSWM